MAAGGRGDVSPAHNARKIVIRKIVIRKIVILDLDGGMIAVNGDNILAFEGGVDWDIVPLAGAGRLAGGTFSVVPHGTSTRP